MKLTPVLYRGMQYESCKSILGHKIPLHYSLAILNSKFLFLLWLKQSWQRLPLCAAIWNNTTSQDDSISRYTVTVTPTCVNGLYEACSCLVLDWRPHSRSAHISFTPGDWYCPREAKVHRLHSSSIFHLSDQATNSLSSHFTLHLLPLSDVHYALPSPLRLICLAPISCSSNQWLALPSPICFHTFISLVEKKTKKSTDLTQKMWRKNFISYFCIPNKTYHTARERNFLYTYEITYVSIIAHS